MDLVSPEETLSHMDSSGPCPPNLQHVLVPATLRDLVVRQDGPICGIVCELVKKHRHVNIRGTRRAAVHVCRDVEGIRDIVSVGKAASMVGGPKNGSNYPRTAARLFGRYGMEAEEGASETRSFCHWWHRSNFKMPFLCYPVISDVRCVLFFNSSHMFSRALRSVHLKPYFFTLHYILFSRSIFFHWVIHLFACNYNGLPSNPFSFFLHVFWCPVLFYFHCASRLFSLCLANLVWTVCSLGLRLMYMVTFWESTMLAWFVHKNWKI